MLDWLIKNPQIIIILLFGVVALIGRAAQMKKEQEEKRAREARRASGQGAKPARQTGRFDPSTMDTAEAERTRRIQEELRRKILARMEGAHPRRDHTPMPRQAEQPALRPAAETVRRHAHAGPSAIPPPLPQTAPKAIEDESADAFRSATEKIAELEAFARDAAAHKDEAFAMPSPDAAAPRAADELIASLQDTRAIRRAFLLREILDKPVGLRM